MQSPRRCLFPGRRWTRTDRKLLLVEDSWWIFTLKLQNCSSSCLKQHKLQSFLAQNVPSKHKCYILTFCNLYVKMCLQFYPNVFYISKEEKSHKHTRNRHSGSEGATQRRLHEVSQRILWRSISKQQQCKKHKRKFFGLRNVCVY